ncbi:MAG: hypothetical protein KGL53_05730, partial [Elusimicrobia bacterium]|nr:hypothetical protein [Elusimicrobiota bacterium]
MGRGAGTKVRLGALVFALALPTLSARSARAAGAELDGTVTFHSAASIGGATQNPGSGDFVVVLS